MPLRYLVLAVFLSVAGSTPVLAQFQNGEPQGVKLADSQVQRWKAGVIIRAVGGTCTHIVATAPMPVDWPEQQVKIVAEDITPSARMSYQTVAGTVKQMLVTIASLPAGDEARAVVTLEIRRSAILPPEDTDRYQLPDLKKLDRQVRTYLVPSPYIESTSSKIVSLSKKVGADQKKAWAKVEAYYDWVRDHVKYENGPLRGALFALNEGRGDCEEMTSLFIALCRASAIPARTVHVPGHCYPEFYLVDEKGQGHWFPCQAAGSRSFGGIPELRPILQKGDNFRDPRNPKQHYHYLPETVTGAGSGGKPQVRFVRELLPKE